MLVTQTKLLEQIRVKYPDLHLAFSRAKITDMDTWVDGAILRLFMESDMQCELAINIRSHMSHLQRHGTWGWQ